MKAVGRAGLVRAAWTVRFFAAETLRAYSANRNLQTAATLAFYGFLSLIPLLLLVVFAFSWLVRSSETILAALTELIAQLFPAFHGQILADLLALAQSRAWGVAGVVALIWSMTPFAGALRAALARIYRTELATPFIRDKIGNLAAVLGMLLMFMGLVGWKILTMLRPLTAPGSLLAAAGVVAPVAVTVAVLALVYQALTPIRLRLAHLLAGALTAAVLLAVIRPLFGWFLRVNPNYGYAFGSLKAIFLLLIWVYYTFAVVLFGAEIMAALRRREALLLRKLFAPPPAGGRPEVPDVLLEKFTRRLAAGERLFAEGMPGAEMYYIRTGAIRLLKGSRELKTLGPREFFGEMSMLLQTQRTATAEAGPEGAQLVVITRENFDLLLRENPAIVLGILRVMAERLKSTSEVLASAPPS